MEEVYYHHYKIVNIEHTEKQIKGLEFIFEERKVYDRVQDGIWAKQLLINGKRKEGLEERIPDKWEPRYPA
ncbi:MAG: hypothetical protein LBC70_03420 [Chitinispirillales bacterium]|jgi:hypothetical protein|nr:hypothetical protein [Chitinispirillales bacterium]